jgi:predicted TIM-barrel fold metal-dependent hydrolase
LIDSHFHLFTAGEACPDARYAPAYDAPFQAWRDAARPVGVRRGVLVQPSFLGVDNTRLCAELRAHPEILRGVAVIAAACTANELHELQSLGVRALRLNVAGKSHELGPWRQATNLWDQLFRLGWHVEIHTDVGGLPHVLAQLPAAMPLVVAHMAKPESASAADPTIATLKARARLSPVHVKLSGAYRLQGRDAGEVARTLRDELGAGSLLWGSDWPCTNHEAQADYPRLLAGVYDWVGEEAAILALTRNPEALYWG